MITCTNCKETKSIDSFHKNKNTNTGRVTWCKECTKEIVTKYKRTERGLCSVIYSEQINSSRERNQDLPNYSRKELFEWITNQFNFKILFNNWTNSNYSKWERPSVDRLDNKLPYTLANIRLVSFRENNKKSHIDARNGDNIISTLVPVDQYDLEGNFIKSYKSMSFASEETGVPIATICVSCSKKYQTAKQWMWKYSNNSEVPIFKKACSTYVQYDNQGNALIEIDSIEKLKEYLNKKDISPLNKAIRLGRQYLGFTWKKYNAN